MGEHKLVKEGQPKQTTPKGLEIPIPKREDFFGMFDKMGKRKAPTAKPEPSEPDPSTR